MGRVEWAVLDRASQALHRIGLAYLFVAFAEHREYIAKTALLEANITLRKAQDEVTRSALAFGLSQSEAGRLSAVSAEFEEDAMKISERHGELFVDAARAVQRYGEGSLQASLAIAKLQDFEEEHAFTLGTLAPALDKARMSLEDVEDAERRVKFQSESLAQTERLTWISWLMLATTIGGQIISVLRAIMVARAAAMGGELALGGLRAGQMTLAGAQLVGPGLAARVAGGIAPLAGPGAAGAAGTVGGATIGGWVFIAMLAALQNIEFYARTQSVKEDKRLIVRENIVKQVVSKGMFSPESITGVKGAGVLYPEEEM